MRYALATDPDTGAHGITCGVCGLTSWNRQDLQHRYCSQCKAFHDDPGARTPSEVARRARAAVAVYEARAEACERVVGVLAEWASGGRVPPP